MTAQQENDDPAVIEFVRPLLGFPEHRRFVLVDVDEAGVLRELVSVDDASLRLVVVQPAVFFPDYAPQVDEQVVAHLQGVDAPDADGSAVVLLVVVNAGTTLESSTANLLAPVLLDASTRRAAQIVLDAPGISVAAPLRG